MRVLWISCLLIGSITCGPVGKGYGSNSDTFVQQQFSPGYGFSGKGVSSDPGSSFPLPSQPNPSFDKAVQLPAPYDAVSGADPGSYGNFFDVSSSGTNMAKGQEFDSGYASFGDEYGAVYAAKSSGYDGSAPGGSYDMSAGAYDGDGPYGFVAATHEQSNYGFAPSYGTGEENPKPVFSDQSDLDPVYSFSSRSSYQRGRAIFAQTHYTPGGPPLMPVSRRISKPASKQSSPFKAHTKGGF